jgi:hypothetical protein
MWEDQVPLEDTSPEDIYVVVAEAFTFEMGPDWHLRD